MADSPPFRMPTAEEHRIASARTHETRHEKRNPLGGRVAALNKLHDQLADDAKLYESDDIQDQRDAVAHALLAVHDYLLAQGFAPLTLAPLMRPVAALVERENNSLDLMFAQRARGGTPKKTLADHERTAILAELANLWLRIHVADDYTQSIKLKQAVRLMKGRWFGSGVTVAQLKSAREIVSQESESHPAVTAARSYAESINKVIAMFGLEASFAIMLRMLNDRKLPFGSGEGGILKTPPVSPNGDS